MAMFGWGSTVNGELGLGGIEEENINIPTPLNFPIVKDIREVACGKNHTLFLTNDGKVYSCGSNDQGQLGHNKVCKRPELIDHLSTNVITRASCGEHHSLVINGWGHVLSWGSDAYGQLGTELGETSIRAPKVIKALIKSNVIQIACGYSHNLALTNGGQLYSWGRNNFGQLGLGIVSSSVNTPTQVLSLLGIPIAFIACGANHSFAVSKSGAVFGWGKNEFGQLGLNDNRNKIYPNQLKTLRTIKVKYIACGEDFSVFLSQDGGVFTCGAGMYGQLGHGTFVNEWLPKKIIELMGSIATQISCGRYHTLALIPSRGRIYAFGLGGSGQLGNRAPLNSATPQLIQDFDSNSVLVKTIYSGGDHNFARVVERTPGNTPDDFRQYSENSQILTIQIDRINECTKLNQHDSVNQELMSYIETVFSSQACINASFLLGNDEHYPCSSKNNGIDTRLAKTAFEMIGNIRNETIKDLIYDCLCSIFPSLLSSPPDVESLRLYVSLIYCYEFNDVTRYLTFHNPFGGAFLRLTPQASRIIGLWWTMCSNEYFTRLINIYKSVVWYVLQQFPVAKDEQPKTEWNKSMFVSLEILGRLNMLNHSISGFKVSYDTFYITQLIEVVDVQLDYINWMSHASPFTEGRIFFCNYPFVFNAKAKTILLITDQAQQMQTAMTESARRAITNLFFSAPLQYFSLITYINISVSRDNLVTDALKEITKYDTKELKKPLKVTFKGEEAEDAGGVTKEFFMLLLKDILDPKYGMFKYYEETRTMWFNEDSLEDQMQFYLIGLICGLAIYNYTIIDLPFPLALYKKLLNEPVCLQDLIDLSPTQGRSLQQVLDYSGNDVEDTFMLNFSITKDVYGEIKNIDLKPNGANIPVTDTNKKEYVELYVDFILNKSVDKYFKKFSEAFHNVCGGKVLELFHSHELMATVVGNENYDWDEFQRNAKYKNGYTCNDETIKIFWEVFHELPLEKKKQFLLFLTGSDRVPILGMSSIEIYIQPTPDDRYLPVAHTCFNLLDLPRYKTKEKLRYKLLQSIQQNLGFSLV